VQGIACVVVQRCQLVPGGGAAGWSGPGEVNWVSVPFCDAMILWDCHGCVSPVIKVCHNKLTALPVSVDGLSIGWGCVVAFSLLVDELPSAASPVDPDLSVAPCEDCVTV
jgi:hypothetical protein